MVWNIPSVSLGQLPWLCPLPRFYPLPACWWRGECWGDSLDAVQVLLSSRQTPGVLSTAFQLPIQSTAL